MNNFNNLKKIGFAVAGVASLSVIVGTIMHQRHVQGMTQTCDEAREIRRDAAKMLGRTMLGGMADLSMESTLILQDAQEIVADCNAQGF